MRFHYEYLENLALGIKDATFESMDQGENLVRSQAIEVWTSIAEEELTRELEGKTHLNLTANIFSMLREKLF